VDALLVFLKRPWPGEVKTRMIPALGPQKAAGLYRVLAEAVARNTRPQAGEYERLLFFAPKEAEGEIASWWPGEVLVAQEGADLGARLTHAFRVAFEKGARRAAVIGTDAPWVRKEHVLSSWEALETHDLVLGPARDGGYYLMALKGEHPELFHEIPWSSPRVLAETTVKAARLGLGVHLLETLPDVDTPEDVGEEWDLLLPLLAQDPPLLEACSPFARRPARGGR
jgi:rSAM/selenodomain-associated transferase 1